MDKNTKLKVEGSSTPGERSPNSVSIAGALKTFRQAAMTTQLTAITHTAPTADYAIQDLTQTTPWGFADHHEGNTVLAVIANLQTRVAELEAILVAMGVLA